MRYMGHEVSWVVRQGYQLKPFHALELGFGPK